MFKTTAFTLASVALASAASAALIPAEASLVASDDFSAYTGTGSADTIVNGAALNQQNTPKTGFTGAWSGINSFTTDLAFNRAQLNAATYGTGTPSPGSGDPAAAIGTATGNIARALATPITKPTAGNREFYATASILITSSYKPAWIQFADANNALLAAFGNQGEVSISGGNNQRLGITTFNNANAQIAAATSTTPSNLVWHNIALYVNWNASGAADLQFFINPSASDAADTDGNGPLTGSGIDARITTSVINTDIAAIRLMTNRGGDHAFFDDFKLYTMPYNEIPEPASLSLLALGALALLRRR